MQDQSSYQTPIPPDDATNVDELSTPKKKFSTLSLIGIITTLTALIGVAIFIYADVMSKIPTRSWRETTTELPWETEQFSVTDIETSWHSSEGDDRMSRRVACYPIITLNLEHIEKSGKLMVSFHNENGQRKGDIISLPFTSSGFKKSNDFNITSEGNKVTFYTLAGYENKDDYLYHQVDYHAPLWSIEVRYMMDGDSEPQLLGKTSIQANTLEKKKD